MFINEFLHKELKNVDGHERRGPVRLLCQKVHKTLPWRVLSLSSLDLFHLRGGPNESVENPNYKSSSSRCEKWCGFSWVFSVLFLVSRPNGSLSGLLPYPYHLTQLNPYRCIFVRLCTIQNNFHWNIHFHPPRRLKRFSPSWLTKWPNAGSTMHSRWLHGCHPSGVSIFCFIFAV